MDTIKTTKEELTNINYLINMIRLTRETWCNLQTSEKLKETNSFKNYSDSQIIIDALKFMECDEEFELNDLFEKIGGKKDDKTN